MTNVLFLALLTLWSPTAPFFGVRSDLQALYDEVDQATLQFDTPSDIDTYHAVRYTNDWTFVDAKGTRHSWNDVRPSMVAALDDRTDWLTDSIEKVVSSKPDQAVVIVNETLVKQATSQLTQYRDTWVKAGDSWKFKMREQVGAPRSTPYKDYAY
jgi:hypothetical protein